MAKSIGTLVMAILVSLFTFQNNVQACDNPCPTCPGGCASSAEAAAQAAASAESKASNYTSLDAVFSPTQLNMLENNNSITLTPEQAQTLLNTIEVSPDVSNALQNAINNSDEVTLNPTQVSSLKSSLDAHNSQGQDQKQSIKVDYPKPLQAIPGTHAYPLTNAGEWTEGNLVPDVFKNNPGMIPGVWIIPAALEECRVIGLPVIFTVERDKRKLVKSIYDAVLNETNFRPEITHVTIFCHEVDQENKADADGINIGLGQGGTNGFAIGFNFGHNESTARINKAIETVIVCYKKIELRKAASVTAPVTVTKRNDAQQYLWDQISEWQRAREEAAKPSVASRRRDSGIAPCDPSPCDERK
jgi:uncharacterized protein (DUF1778 family)